ncbi:hypothetical protein GMI70_02805 [Eggerthellaceae bacterium zg-893]|nr:hypothetical protein [Eggerthellaceae bacterium zg-893]
MIKHRKDSIKAINAAKRAAAERDATLDGAVAAVAGVEDALCDIDAAVEDRLGVIEDALCEMDMIGGQE